MAKKAVEVRECDRCGKEPAHTWMITGPEGAVREIELCERHGAPIANAYALGRAVRPRVAGGRRRGGGTRPESMPVIVDGPVGVDGPVVVAQPEPAWR